MTISQDQIAQDVQVIIRNLDAARGGVPLATLIIDRLRRGWFHYIPNRAEDALYLLRVWLSEPRPQEDCSGPFNSADSTLVHLIFRPDDDGALHCHPWSFTTQIINGWYIEENPAISYAYGALGPIETATIKRRAGDIVSHKARDLHRIIALSHDLGLVPVMTLVRTGPKERDWGFHPAGQTWVPWRTYLASKLEESSAS